MPIEIPKADWMLKSNPRDMFKSWMQYFRFFSQLERARIQVRTARGVERERPRFLQNGALLPAGVWQEAAEFSGLYFNRDAHSLLDNFRRCRPLPTFKTERYAARILGGGGVCWICKSPEVYCLDHVRPKSRRGSNQSANLRPICNQCNAIKGSRWPFPMQPTEARAVIRVSLAASAIPTKPSLRRHWPIPDPDDAEWLMRSDHGESF